MLIVCVFGVFLFCSSNDVFVLCLDDLPGGSGGISLSPQDMFRLGQQLVDEIDSRAARTIQSGMSVTFSLFVLRLLSVVVLGIDL